jgi:hypothetical protein
MFNFRPSVSQAAADAMLGRLRELAGHPAIGGFMVGKNLSPELFPTRFEWIYMIQFDEDHVGTTDPVYRRFMGLRDELSSLCRNQVECDLNGAFPLRFADAPGVKIRHTVMFDFKADASQEARERNVSAIRRMGGLPMVQHYVVDRATVPATDPTQMEWQVIGDFASLEDYQAYSDAPVHRAIREDFTAHISRVAFLDVKV